VPPHDVTAWTAALHKGLTDADWRRQAGDGGAVEVARYRWQTTAQETIESYRRALKDYG
jgi:hypothetical protein